MEIKKKELIIIFLAIILFFYLSEPVPLCELLKKEVIVGDAVYTSSEIEEFKFEEIMALRVSGKSMLPSIQDKSQCLCIQKEKYEVRDIVFYIGEINGEFHGISHRIIDIDGDKIIVKGDGNDFYDPPIKKEDIICAIPQVSRVNILFSD